MEYEIRPAGMRDVHAVRRLELLVFRKDAYSYLNISTLMMWPGAANFKLLDHGHNLIGFVAGQPNFANHIDWIITLCVHPDHTRRGLGRRLLDAAENAMTQPRLRLTVRVSNTGAIRLYEVAGYTRLYTEPRYYSDGEDGIVMEKARVYPDATSTR
jgi:[ribosomal protein S18]-alanine N-acetyltransferase